ncbi:ABC transporter permease [Micrococcales bacterium 31B]|nr:ABC transporter permease [Micrococcales bacterium 31B]
MIASAFARVFSPAEWQGAAGIGARVLEHLGYSALALLIAAVIALPLGFIVGHTGRGQVVIVGFVNVLRSLPTFGLMLLIALSTGIGLSAPLVALVILALPPLLAGTFSGILAIERTTVAAARAVGLRPWQVLFQVEVPNALPSMLTGLRAAALQVIATATVAAYVGVGGLGRYLFDGLAVQDYETVVLGAILVALLALVVDATLAGLAWWAQPGTNRMSRPSRDLVSHIEKLKVRKYVTGTVVKTLPE